ncbi:autotransporter assembly complex protein TamA [Altericroceibacterium xinjiangense]|uniref:autotransporter assembly complex protein TamA n=1 Tax=Altericroceibacterium xinjiangense TaxID=762261 RepID=UPI001F493E94|nr:BamA/TamA family outer membrane protein [Altericroceibacterium xinjiangense]
MSAQDPDAASRLEELIPDSAVENPVEWAQQGSPPEVEVLEDAPPEVQANSPLAEMPLVTVPWPEETELPLLAPLDAEDDIQFADLGIEGPAALGLEDGFEVEISNELALVFPSDDTLFPERDEFVSRFRSLSTIEQLEDENVTARLAAQAQADQDLLERLLRIYGYYEGQVVRRTAEVAGVEEPAETAPSVRFDVMPGTQYTFSEVDLGALDEAGEDYPLLRNAFEIEAGDPILADKIVEERYDLDEALGENGYPFAEIEEPELLIDHATDMGDLVLPVTPGGKYAFGRVISDMPDFLSSEHLATIARFDPGDTYQRSLELDLRQALLATGIVSSVTVTPVVAEEPSAGDPGTVNLEVGITPAELRTIAGSIGYGTGEGFRAEASWEHRNLFPPEGMVRARVIAGTQEQLLGVLFRKSNFGGRDRILTLDAYATTIDSQAYDSQRLSFIASYGRVNTLYYQKSLTWSVGLELVASKERPPRVDDLPQQPYQTYFVAAIPLQAQIDTSDDLLNPTEGFRVGGMLSPEISHTGGAESFYLRSRVDAAYYRQMSEKVILAGRVRFGSIPGAPISAIAPSRRFYAGGGGSVRGYGYQAIGPRNELGEPSGGRSVTELSLEGRIQTGLLDGAVSIVPFIDAGSVSTSPTPTFDEIKIGAGVGMRYLTGFGPIRVDVGIPLNPGPYDAPVGVYVGLGQAF